jgi:hypothetical protein
VEWYWRGKPKNSEKNLSSANLSTTNATCIDPGGNLGLRGERPANNRLSHSTAHVPWLLWLDALRIIRCSTAPSHSPTPSPSGHISGPK